MNRAARVLSRCRDAVVAARVCVLRLTIERRLERGPLDRVLAELTQRADARRTSSALRDEQDRIERVAARLLAPDGVFSTTCLYRALIRYALLREAGFDVHFVVGVRAAN